MSLKIQGNLEGFNLARKRISFLNNPFNIGRLNSGDFIFFNPFYTIKIVWMTSIYILVDPGDRLLSSWAKLKSAQALIVGFLYGIIANILFVNSLYFKGQVSVDKEILLKIFILEFIPLLSLMGVSFISQLVCRRHPKFIATVFLSGVSLLPFIFLVSLDTFVFDLPNFIKFIGGIFAGCYSLFVLYNGCLQIYNLSEKMAAFTSSIMLTITSLNVWFVL